MTIKRQKKSKLNDKPVALIKTNDSQFIYSLIEQFFSRTLIFV